MFVRGGRAGGIGMGGRGAVPEKLEEALDAYAARLAVACTATEGDGMGGLGGDMVRLMALGCAARLFFMVYGSSTVPGPAPACHFVYRHYVFVVCWLA